MTEGPPDRPSLHGWRPNLGAEFQRPVRPHEVLVGGKQPQMIFETALPSRVIDRPPKKIGRALSDREVQPLDERSGQFRGVLGGAQRPFESPPVRVNLMARVRISEFRGGKCLVPTLSFQKSLCNFCASSLDRNLQI